MNDSKVNVVAKRRKKKGRNRLNNKRFWWLKLREDFFKQKEMKKLRRIAGGNTYTIIYIKMQLLSVKNNGLIFFESVEDNLVDELALELDESSEDVQMTLMFLEKHGLIEQIEEDRYLLPEAAENIGTESASAERMRKHREGNSKKDHYATILNWWRRDGKKENKSEPASKPAKHHNTSYDLAEIEDMLDKGLL